MTVPTIRIGLTSKICCSCCLTAKSDRKYRRERTLNKTLNEHNLPPGPFRKATSNSETPKESVESTDTSPPLKRKNASPSTSTYLEMEETDDHIQDHEGESSNSYKDGELKTSHEFIQMREQFPITSSGLPMHTTIITQNDSDIDAGDKVIIFDDGSIKRRKFKEMVEDTVVDVLTTVRDCVDRQTNAVDPATQTQTMLNHFSRFVASSLIGLPSRKRNAAIAHITAYLTDVRSEEDL